MNNLYAKIVKQLKQDRNLIIESHGIHWLAFYSTRIAISIGWRHEDKYHVIAFGFRRLHFVHSVTTISDKSFKVVSNIKLLRRGK